MTDGYIAGFLISTVELLSAWKSACQFSFFGQSKEDSMGAANN
jgi:hypothetical protein